MLSSSFLDTAIGIVFVFLLLSLIASAINEILLSWIKMRGRMLLRGIQTLLNDSGATGFVQQIYNHGQIFGLFEGEFDPRKPGNLPSYIPTQNFVMAFLGVLPSVPKAASDAANRTVKYAQAEAVDARNKSAAAPKDASQAERDSLAEAARKAEDYLDWATKRAAQKKAIADSVEGVEEALNSILGAPTTPTADQTHAEARAAQLSTAFGQLKKLATALGDDPETEKVGRPLYAMLVMAGNDFDKLKKSIADWYDSSMDRVSGWYKYHTQTMLLYIGLVLAAALNADTLKIVRQLSQDPTLRQALVVAAQKFKPTDEQKAALAPTAPVQDAKAPAPDAKGSVLGAKGSTSDAKGSAPNATPPAPDRTGSAPDTKGLAPDAKGSAPDAKGSNQPGEQAAKPKSDYQKLADEISQVQGLGIPLGWSGVQFTWWSFIGIPLTAIAVSLGAPFWFDILNKFMVVRSTVKPEEKSKEEGSKDKKAS